MTMFNRVNKKEILDYTRTLSLLLLSKISFISALELISKQIKDLKLKEINKKILHEIKTGVPASKSFAKYPDYFTEVFIANLKIAEETGQTGEIIHDYADYLEKMDALKKKIIQAIRYPFFILMVAAGVVIFMLVFIVPAFEGLFSSVNAELPFITSIIVKASDFLINSSFIKIFFPGLIIFLIYLFTNRILKDKLMDKVIWKLPVISRLYLLNLLSRFTLSMGTLLKNRVTLLESLKISRNVSSSALFKIQIDNLIKRIIRGEKISSNLSNKFFDVTFIRLLSVGEESAELDTVFLMMSKYYSNEFDYKLDSLTSMLEPALILIIGIFVSIILVALYLPMFDLINYFGV